MSKSSFFDQSLALEQVGDGHFERDLDRTWWGWNGQFGGYVLALALEACRHAVPNAAHTERSLSLNFLRRVQDGRCLIEVDVVRSGRTVSNMTLSVTVAGKLVATGMALFASVRDSEAFTVAVPPSLDVPTGIPDRSPIPAPAMDRLHIWPAEGAGLMAGADVTEGGGWMQLRDVGGADERFGFFAADGCIPVSYSRFSKPQVGGSLDLTAYFREPFPQTIIDGDEPIRVVLRSARAYQGYVDEDADLWSAEGRLLMQTRQTRYTELVDVDALKQMAAEGELRLMPGDNQA